MRSIISDLHAIWCVIINRQQTKIEHESYIRWMQEQEREANVSTESIRKRRNIYEEHLRRKREEQA